MLREFGEAGAEGGVKLPIATTTLSAGRRPAKRRTLATPTEFGKNANIDASFGESPI